MSRYGLQAFQLVGAQLNRVMEGIARNGVAPFLNRTLPPKRQDFLKHYVQAQMVTYENVTDAWFYWTLKTEGGAFAEWDFLRGLHEGWMTVPTSSAQQEFGNCDEIMLDTKDNYSIVHEYPNASLLNPSNWQGADIDIDDDVVMSHGESLLTKNHTNTSMARPGDEHDDSDDAVPVNHFDNDTTPVTTSQTPPPPHHHHWSFGSVLLIAFTTFAVKQVFLSVNRRKQERYTELRSSDEHHSLVV